MTIRERLRLLRETGYLARVIWGSGPFLVLSSLLLHVLRAGFPFLLLWIPKLILDAVITLSRTSGHSLATIWRLLALEMALAFVNDLLGRLNNLCDSLLGDRFTNRLNMALMHHAAQLDLQSFEDPAFYDKLARAREQTGAKLAIFISALTLFQDMVTIAVLSVGLAVFSTWLIGLLLIAVIPSLFGEGRLRTLAYSILYRMTPERRLLDYLRFLGASAQTVKEVKIFGLNSHLESIYADVSDQIDKENAKVSTRRAAFGSLLSVVSIGSYYAGYVRLILLAVAGAISIGTFTFLTGSFNRCRQCVDRVTENLNGLSENIMLLKDLFDFFKLEPVLRSPVAPRPIPSVVRRGLEFRNVSFSYPGMEAPVLRHVSFRLAPTETVALVGQNGAGKTTIVKLATRLYDPTAGEILLDGVDIREYKLEDLRRVIGVIFQDFVQYDMTVRENIGFGDVGNLCDAERVESAARASGAAEFIDKFPQRYSQLIGQRFDGGKGLSGGQWQKIALARAYMRKASLIILDEPTASLDAQAEYETFRHFTALSGGRMAILISHRFSTVRMANRILVLADGQLQEQGTHEELVALAGRYAELFELQAAGYR